MIVIGAAGPRWPMGYIWQYAPSCREVSVCILVFFPLYSSAKKDEKIVFKKKRMMNVGSWGEHRGCDVDNGERRSVQLANNRSKLRRKMRSERSYFEAQFSSVTNCATTMVSSSTLEILLLQWSFQFETHESAT